MVEIEVRFFNSLTQYNGGRVQRSLLLDGARTVGDALKRLPVPEGEIFLALHNGRNIMRGFGCGSGIETEHELRQGDVLALSGPVPFSRGYGAPVV
ncbi:MAG TPA: hypothetical protein VNN09_15300 [Candidatus Competibacteraceae bacterium]|nr:hypothetical protein [Candidatus Competibacteraceae bacterium]